jgi:RimJ/RimL family protein N-acetyltransferase
MTAIEHVTLDARRFELRPPAASDAAEALDMLLDPDVRQWHPGPPDPTLRSTRDWLVRSAGWTESYAGWSVHDREEGGRYVGNAYLVQISSDQRSAVVAYRVAAWARGRGAATSALRAMSRFAFSDLDLERLTLPHALANPASCRVAEKAGFRLEGTEIGGFRDDDGRRWDSHLHGLLMPGVVSRSAV